MQHSIPVSHSKVEFCGVQKQNGKLVTYSVIVSSVVQGQIVVNVHKFACR